MRYLWIVASLTVGMTSCLLDRAGSNLDGETAGSGGVGDGGNVAGATGSAGGATNGTGGMGAGGMGTGGDFVGCGDGVLDPQTEQCDDGNQLDNDHCSANCIVECNGGFLHPTTLHCYRLFTTTMSWSNAYQQCAQLGGGYDLTAVTSAGERNFLDDVVDSGDSVWTGGNDSTTEGVFVWSNGETFTGNLWGNPEPNGGANENCVRLSSMEGDSNDVLRDTDCAETRRYVCELTPAGMK